MSLVLLAAIAPACTRANPSYLAGDGGLPLPDVIPGTDIAILGDGPGPVTDGPTPPTDQPLPPGPDIPVPPPDRPGPPRDGDPPPPTDLPPAASFIGNPCGSDFDCVDPSGRQGFCVTDLPGGYCSAGCTQGDPDSCGPGAVCLDSNQGSFCAQACPADGCRKGYACSDTFFGIPSAAPICTPGGNTDAPIGAPCGDQSDCQAGQFCLQDFTGGYCTHECDATDPGSCGPGAECVGGDPNGGGVCLATCGRTSDCQALRDGQGTYGCSFKAFGSPVPQRVCLPFDPDARIGDACESESDCTLGGLCIAEGSQQPPFPGGYCTDFCDPRSGSGCPGSSSGSGSGRSVCVAIPDSPQLGVCLAECDDSTDCRQAEGYTCNVATQNGTQACFP